MKNGRQGMAEDESSNNNNYNNYNIKNILFFIERQY